MWREMGRGTQAFGCGAFYLQQEEGRASYEGLLQVQDGYGLHSNNGKFGW
tara:strand:- start:1105 stop:1254 length:150 start_codon:yes stop_codon:yes gene_type:complete